MGLNNLRAKASEKSDRKLEKKVEFYSKVRSQAIAATKTTITKSKRSRKRAKQLKAYDLSTLSELLPELSTEKREVLPEKFKLNSKSRQKVLLREGKQFKCVVTKPEFLSDPFSAIHTHLQMTQPIIEESQKEKKKMKSTNGKAKKRAKKRAAASRGGHLMESMEL